MQSLYKKKQLNKLYGGVVVYEGYTLLALL